MNRRAALLGAAASACAPVVQTPGTPGLGFGGPRLEPDAYVAFDGTRLGLTVWEAKTPEPWAVIVGLHGMNDYAEAFTLAAPVWAEAGVTTYAYDQRGFGRSPNRGLWPGQALLTEDLRVMTRLVRARHPRAVLAVVGESMGGAVAVAAFASERPPVADRLVLLAPAVWGWGDQPLLYRSTLWLGAHTLRSYSVSPPPFVQRRIRASDNVEHLHRMGRDRNLIFRTRIDTIYGLVSLMQTARTRMDDLKQAPPVFYAYGANDDIIPDEPSFAAAAQLRPSDRTAFYAEGFHMLTRDLQRAAVIDDVLSFIRDASAPLSSRAPTITSAARSAAGVVRSGLEE